MRTGLLLTTVVLVACGGAGGTTIPDAPAAQDETEETTAPGEPAATAPSKPSEPAGTKAPVTPTGLTCVAAHYVGAPSRKGVGWALRLPDASELSWDDGATKTFDQKIDAADLEDTLSIPYPTGAIVPINTPNLDPGRIRNDGLFKATFGASEAAVRAQLVDVAFVGQTVKFHTRAAAALGRVSDTLTKLVAAKSTLGQYVKGELGGTFAWRPIANTNRLSAHSYGIAIDIVVAKSDYWEWDKGPDGSFTWTNRIPEAIVAAFEAEGFIWGGRWHHYDTMHFEYRPELFDKTCKP